MPSPLQIRRCIFNVLIVPDNLAALWLWNLQPIEPRLDGLRSLHLRDDNKQIIQALVKTHFIKKGYAREKSSDFDVVRGKGSRSLKAPLLLVTFTHTIF